MPTTTLLLLILASVLLMSLIAAAGIAFDKFWARRKGDRVPEATLHTLELLGGWPGALWARRRFRHKTRKATYVWKARAMAGLHVVWVVLLMWFAAS
jgi:uncharacterized membrane protein YsdA (DUF1294 family)